jgi:hypothetical protein
LLERSTGLPVRILPSFGRAGRLAVVLPHGFASVVGSVRGFPHGLLD